MVCLIFTYLYQSSTCLEQNHQHKCTVYVIRAITCWSRRRWEYNLGTIGWHWGVKWQDWDKACLGTKPRESAWKLEPRAGNATGGQVFSFGSSHWQAPEKEAIWSKQGQCQNQPVKTSCGLPQAGPSEGFKPSEQSHFGWVGEVW